MPDILLHLVYIAKLILYHDPTLIFLFFWHEINRVEDAVIRYLNRKSAGSDAPGST